MVVVHEVAELDLQLIARHVVVVALLKIGGATKDEDAEGLGLSFWC